MNSELAELLVAVDALTKPQVVAQWQGEEGARKIFKRTDEPLLVQLRTAIHNNIGGSGGGKQARERTPLDVGAFALFERIDGRVRSWMSELGGKVGKDLQAEAILRSWFVMWSSGQHEPAEVLRYASVVEGWAQQIRDKLDPPPQIEITSPCPVCGVEWVNIGLKLPDGSDDPDDVERVRVLAAVERENMDDSYAMCKSCNRVWRGVGQMRSLRIAIDDREAASAKGQSA
jgi:hypothetical protein